MGIGAGLRYPSISNQRESLRTNCLVSTALVMHRDGLFIHAAIPNKSLVLQIYESFVGFIPRRGIMRLVDSQVEGLGNYLATFGQGTDIPQR